MSDRPPRHSDLRYRLISRLIHHPRLLRLAAAMLRRKPSLARIARVVAGRDAVAAVFHRQESFCPAHAPNLRAGEFVIGMAASRRQQEDRKFLEAVLPAPERFAALSAMESRRRIEAIRASGDDRFDLIDDYMVFVVWRALRLALGPGGTVTAQQPTNAEPGEPFKGFVKDLRRLGAQLVIGSVSPSGVRADADRGAERMNERMLPVTPVLKNWWKQKARGSDSSIARNAVGLMWVGHPATVQAGALCMQELFARRAVLDKLSIQAQALGETVWLNSDFRKLLADHVLELLRFRPPFPILVRDVPRDTWFDVGKGIPPGRANAGSQVTLLTIGAMFDDGAVAGGRADKYCPGRGFNFNGDRYLMFGLGDRSCIAKHQVVAMLVSALAGLLTLPGLRWADPWSSRIAYDGPTITRMRLRFDR
jgi:hypothetical protein